jgi:hypothetical protein
MIAFEIKFQNIIDLKLDLNLWVVLLLVLALCAIIFLPRFFRKGRLSRTFEFDGAEIGIGSQTVKVRTNSEDLRICYNLWVEMSTRKIGLLFDTEKDVIVEVYDSWYSFFGIARDLIKSIPITKVLGNASTNELVRVSVEVLNLGLRPHLTSWQAKFRKWYENEISKPENAQLSPQEIQRKYPQYTDLVEDLIKINRQLVLYKEKLATLLQ